MCGGGWVRRKRWRTLLLGERGRDRGALLEGQGALMTRAAKETQKIAYRTHGRHV